MRRRIFTIAAGLSLVMAMGLALLWGRSMHSVDSLSRSHYGPYEDRPFPDFYTEYGWSAVSARGGVKLGLTIAYCKGPPAAEPRLTHFRGMAMMYPFFGTRSLIASRNHPTFMQKLGFGFSNESSGRPPFIVRGVIVPDYFLMALLLVFPGLWLRRVLPVMQYLRRCQHGLCGACGYDLRAGGERCPECGTAVVRFRAARSQSHAARFARA